MFNALRILNRHNAMHYRLLEELTDKLEKLGMFERMVDLDAQEGRLVLSRRRGYWTFAWGYVPPDPKRQGALEVYLGRAGSLIKISCPFVTHRDLEKTFRIETVSDVSSASEEFRQICTEIADEAVTPGDLFRSAQRLAAFFLKQPA